MFNDESRNLTMTSLAVGEWRTGEDVVYDNGLIVIGVPKGTLTDLASIPAAFRWLVSNDDRRIIRPAIVHDWLYMLQGKLPAMTLSRSHVDLLFYEMLRVEGMGWWKARMMWAAVRVGGSIAWNN
jgi:hypothetical protein